VSCGGAGLLVTTRLWADGCVETVVEEGADDGALVVSADGDDCVPTPVLGVSMDIARLLVRSREGALLTLALRSMVVAGSKASSCGLVVLEGTGVWLRL
jgi:hypothetical protein